MPFSSYLTLNNIVTLKSGLSVVHNYDSTSIRLRFNCDQRIDMSIFLKRRTVSYIANHSAVGGALSVTYDDVFIYNAVYYGKNVKNCN